MTSPTAIPSPRPPLRSTFEGGMRLTSVGLTRPQRERHAVDSAAAVLDALGPDSAALFLQYAHPWVQTGETA